MKENPFKVGDWAFHAKSDLDPRQVAKVEGSFIWLDLGGTTVGPLPASNYTKQEV